jgi:DNA-binding transcriptional MerR regulator
MKTYTVSELAELAGISVRALHHYDEIGLLKPSRVGDNRYRYYGEEELLRLQQILIHRELGLSLGEIGAVLDDPAFDRLETLVKQRDRLEIEARRYRRMLKTIDRTIAKLKGEKAMKDRDLYSGVISPQKQAEYEVWLVERYGECVRAEIEASKVEAQSTASPDMAGVMQDLKPIEGALVEAMRGGMPRQHARSLPLSFGIATGLPGHGTSLAHQTPMRSWLTSMRRMPTSLPATKRLQKASVPGCRRRCEPGRTVNNNTGIWGLPGFSRSPAWRWT